MSITPRRADARGRACALWAGLWLAGGLILPSSAGAADLPVPQAGQMRHEDRVPHAIHGLALGPWQTDFAVQPVEGAVHRRAWALPQSSATIMQIAAPLREGLRQAGFRILYECTAPDCGGFDFRYAIEVLPPSVMAVDFADYYYLSAQRPAPDAQQPHTASLLVSRGGGAGHVQMITVAAPAVEGAAPTIATAGTEGADALADTAPTQSPPGGGVGGDPFALSTSGAGPAAAGLPAVGAALEQAGHVVLADLSFASGASALEAAPSPMLESLAAYLRADPARRVMLVGHTDAEGSLPANLALSRQRAEAVRQRLLRQWDVPAAQVSAEGIGFLAPIASNLTRAGRLANRRVEAVLLP